MDLKAYYQKIRDIEAQVEDDYPVVVSKGTEDGGKGGIATEVTRPIAAKLVVEGSARLATSAEAKAFRDARAEAKRASDRQAAASQVHLTVLSSSELEKLKGTSSKKQD